MPMRSKDSPIRVKVEDLKPGMFIQLAGTWIEHSFVRNSFLLKNQTQIQKLAKQGTKEVIVHPLKSSVLPVIEKKSRPAPSPETIRAWETPLMPENFNKILKDATVPPKQKAGYIYEASLDVMDRLLKNPNVENLTQFKEGVSDIVDLILDDNETSSHLLNITNHDYYTFTHSVNVGVLSILLTKALYGSSSPHDMGELGAAFFLHDLGKIHIPDTLITKPGVFNDEERRIMQAHPKEGFQILSDTDQLSPECKIIVMQHHERADGSGYPLGLKNNEIHAYGRICSIADVFDALTSERPYKAGLTPFEALSIMKNQMGHHFSPDIFAEFVKLFSR